jgi:amidohydrolase
MPVIGRRMGVVLALWALTGPAGAADVGAEVRQIDRTLDQIYPDLFRLYADIHAHPELAGQETRTAALLAEQMRELGFTVTEHVGGTGVVAVLRNGDGPTVLVRTELDALPMEERTGLPYASRVQVAYNGGQSFVAHSCGHDVNMAAWVGTARTLLAMKDGWRGTLVFVGQPAEETGQGAMAMLADGLFDRFPKPDYAFGLHTGGGPAGQLLYRPGPITANSNSFTITFRGQGGHGAAPHRAIDPVLIAARFVVEVQSIVSRGINPQQPGVVTVGAIQGGTTGNIIPDEVTVRGTIRSFDAEARASLVEGVERVARAASMMAGAPEPEIALNAGSGAIVNDPELTERTAAVFREAFGAAATAAPGRGMVTDDYARLVEAGVPRSLFFYIGVHEPSRVEAARNSGEALPGTHSPFYAPVPEPSIRTGVKAMSLAVLSVLAG